MDPQTSTIVQKYKKLIGEMAKNNREETIALSCFSKMI